MKYKMVGLIACATVLFVGILDWQSILRFDDHIRYHQHLEAPQKTECTIEHTEGELCTHLPIISIDTDGIEIPGAAFINEEGSTEHTMAADGSDRITAHLDTYDSESAYNHVSDASSVSSEIEIHVRGNSSRYFDKLGYHIKLIHEDGSSNLQNLLGMDAHQDWALHGPFLDKTLIRNYMWYNIAGEIMDYAPNVRFCELVLNGEYQGVYVLMETITAGENGSRLSLSVNEKDNAFTGYVLRLDRGSDNELKNIDTFSSYSRRTQHILNIEYPGASVLDEEMAEAIRQEFSDFEKMLYSYDFESLTPDSYHRQS